MIITSYYGMRLHPLDNIKKFHRGIDLAANKDPIRSVLPGIVKDAGYKADLGNYVLSSHGEITLLYGHLSEIHVQIHQPLDAGQIIGITGKTGKATSEHLHFSVYINARHIDPLLFLEHIKKTITKNK